MLDRLFVGLAPLLAIASMWEQLSPSESGPVFWVMLVAFAGPWLLYSLLEAVADESRRPRQRTPYDPVHDYPPNSFSERDQPQERELLPPAPIRSFVMMFGVRGARWISVLELLVFLCAFTLAWMLAYKSGEFWAGAHPALAQQAVREQVFLAAAVTLTISILRGWAVEQRQRLSPLPPPGLPVVGSIFLGVWFTAFLGMLLSELFGFGLLPGLVVGPSLMAVALLPPWRDKVLVFLFGKREPVDARS